MHSLHLIVSSKSLGWAASRTQTLLQNVHVFRFLPVRINFPVLDAPLLVPHLIDDTHHDVIYILFKCVLLFVEKEFGRARASTAQGMDTHELIDHAYPQRPRV